MKHGSIEVQPAHPIDKRSGRSPRSHHRLFRGNSHVATVVESEIFEELIIKLPLTAPAPVGFEQTRRSNDSNGHKGQSIDLKACAPVITQPLTPVFSYRGITG